MSIDITLKSIKVDQRASRGTFAYSAKLHHDGVHVCDVANEGNGGADRMVGPGRKLDYAESLKRYDELSRRFPKEMPLVDMASPGEPPSMAEDSLEYFCARLVEDHLLRTMANRDMRRSMLFFKDGLPPAGSRAPILMYRLEGDPAALAARIRSAHPDAYILNEQSIEDVMAAYRRAE